MQGRVKWFDNRRGFGFIVSDSGEDVFIHYTSIDKQGYKTLNEGQYVEFEVIDIDRGLQAKHVKPIDNIQTIK